MEIKQVEARRGESAQSSQSPRVRRSAGFTLIEIMAVVLIMGLLMSLVGVAVFSQVDKARVTTTRMKIKQVGNSLERYYMDNGRYPTSEQGLQALLQKPSGSPEPRNYPRGGYIRDKGMISDAWDQPLEYESPGQRNPDWFDLWSTGADGSPGGTDTNEDIGNWDAGEQHG